MTKRELQIEKLILDLLNLKDKVSYSDLQGLVQLLAIKLANE